MGARILTLLFLFILTACGSDAPVHREVTYGLPPTPGGRMCMDQCNKSRDYCQQSCDLDNRACTNDVQAEAQKAYDTYARDRLIRHLPTTLLPSDFEHLDLCVADKKRCYATCDRPYDSCFQSCGGTVSVTSSCQFLCFE